MDIELHSLLVERLDIALPEEIFCTLAQDQHVDALIGGAIAAAQRLQAGGVKGGVDHCAGQLGAVIEPVHQLFKIQGDAGVNGAAVELAQHAAPEPARELGVDARLAPAVAEQGHHPGEGHQLGGVGQLTAAEEALAFEEVGRFDEALLHDVGPAPIGVKWEIQNRGALGADWTYLLAHLTSLEVFQLALAGLQQSNGLEQVGALHVAEQFVLLEARLAGGHVAYVGAEPIVAQVIALGGVTGSDQLEHRELHPAGINLLEHEADRLLGHTVGVDTFHRAGLEAHLATGLHQHHRAHREGTGDADQQALHVVIVPHPSALEVGELGLAGGDVFEQLGQRTLGAVEGSHGGSLCDVILVW